MPSPSTEVPPRRTARTLLPGRARRAALLVVVAALLAASGWPWAVATYHLRSARSALVGDDVDSALEHLKQTRRWQPERAAALFLSAKAARRAGRLPEAKEYLDLSFQRGWCPEAVRDERYLTLVQTGRFVQARPYLEYVFRDGTADERAYEVYEAMAKGYLATYRLRDAIICLNHFISWRPDALNPRLWRAEIWERFFRWEDACREYEEILDFFPDHSLARRKYGDALLALNRVQWALEQYEHALQADPDCVESLLGAAKCRWQLGDGPRSEAAFRTLRECDLTAPQRTEVLLGLGQILAFRSNHAEAIRFLEAAREADPSNAQVHYLLGTAYSQAGRSDEGIEALEEARRLRDQTSRFGAIMLQLFDYPDDADLRWEAGMLLMAQGHRDEGAAWISTALIIDPDHKNSHAALAEYYAASSQPDEARYHRELLAALDGGPASVSSESE